MSRSITLSDAITDVLEANDFTIIGTYEQDGRYYSECEVYSPAGEDVIVTVWYDGTTQDFVRSFREYADDFDPDEHAEMWVESRGENGVPSTIRELIDDAEAIKATLMDVAELLCA